MTDGELRDPRNAATGRTEPDERRLRQDGVTRPTPPTDHLTHDELLIAAFAAGDVEGSALEAARELIGSCDECRALAADLGALTAAIRSRPDPVRPRDFRLAPEQAAGLRRRGIGRFVPSLRTQGFARPLGTAMATLGLAGLLLTTVLGGQSLSVLSHVGSALSPIAGSSEMAARAPASGGSQSNAHSGAEGGVAAPSPAASGTNAADQAKGPGTAGEVPGSGQSATPETAFGAASPTPSPAAAPSVVAPPSAGAPAPAAGTTSPPVPSSAGAGTTPTTPSIAPSLAPASTAPGGPPVALAASFLVLLAGLGLLGADRLARRR
jgi:hypothetical protein